MRASPVVSVGGPSAGITVAVPEFWQQFPKAIDTQENTLNIRLFPGQSRDVFELQGGEQKTHTVWLQFDGAGQPSIEALNWAHRPNHVHCTPEWYAATKVIPWSLPASNKSDDRYESYLAPVVDGSTSLFARREIIDEFGWRNYGEVYADHEAEHYEGEAPVVSHYNNQYDLVFGMLLQYMRSGNSQWFDLADSLARHVIDIDVYHTDRDKAAYNRGLFWHTNHYRDASTCTHRAYSRHNFRPGDPFAGGGPSSNHNYSTGLLHHYYMTGDPKARETVIGLAEWVVNMDDGQQSVFGVLDPSPTGNATYPGEPNYQGPCRGAGNSINVLLDGWRLTRLAVYLEKAEGLIRRVSHPEENVAGRNLLCVEPRWSYTVFLSALARYLAVKAEAGQLDFMYSYARAVLMRYARWMLEHEKSYFDQLEQLEYPNETWAAQDFRKANVLRLAASHAGEAEQLAMLERGNQLGERAWKELLRFGSRHSTRAVALLLAEGPRDAFFANSPAIAPSSPGLAVDFGTPAPFVPQKERIAARLRSVRGCATVLLQLCDPRSWRKLRLRGYFY